MYNATALVLLFFLYTKAIIVLGWSALPAGLLAWWLSFFSQVFKSFFVLCYLPHPREFLPTTFRRGKLANIKK